MHYISDMKAAYQQASLDMERRIIQQQRDYQQKISTLLRQFNEDSSGKLCHVDIQIYLQSPLIINPQMTAAIYLWQWMMLM